MKSLILLRENFKDNYETKESGDDLFIEGIFGMADYINENRRYYVKEKMKEAVETYNKDYFETNRAVGELGHPDTAILNPDRICLKVKDKLVLDETTGEVRGRAKIMKNLPLGNIAYTLLKEGIKLGISTRGLGDVIEDEIDGVKVNKVIEYKLIAPDLVMEPSTGKFVDTINENIRYRYENGKIKEIVKEGVTPKKVAKMDLVDVIQLIDFLIKGGK